MTPLPVPLSAPYALLQVPSLKEATPVLYESTLESAANYVTSLTLVQAAWWVSDYSRETMESLLKESPLVGLSQLLAGQEREEEEV